MRPVLRSSSSTRLLTVPSSPIVLYRCMSWCCDFPHFNTPLLRAPAEMAPPSPYPLSRPDFFSVPSAPADIPLPASGGSAEEASRLDHFMYAFWEAVDVAVFGPFNAETWRSLPRAFVLSASSVSCRQQSPREHEKCESAVNICANLTMPFLRAASRRPRYWL